MAKTRKVKVRGAELSVRTDLKCIGSICFQTDGSIKVVIPKDASLECAKRTAASILGGKKVQFEIEGRQLAEKEARV